MKWNWQHKNWPNFIYDAAALSEYESQFLHKAGIMHGSLKHVTEDDKDSLRVELISEEAYKTSEIEGEILDRDSLQSSIRRHFGLKTDNRRVPAAEQGIAEMLVDLYKTFDRPLDHKRLFLWHEMLTNGRRDLQDMGRYRAHEEPMQIVSGSFHEPEIHFEAPPSKDVPKEMDAFILWFNKTDEMPMLLRSGIAHVYFESIHPFEDGNGRIGRAISEKALSQGLGRPTLIALAKAIERSRKAYYAALQIGNRSLDVQDWLEYYCQTVLAAQDYTQSMIDFLIEKSKFYDRFSSQLNERQAKVVARMFKEGIEGFKGGLSAENYISISGAARATATRDLQALVEMGALKKTGERKYTRYYLNIEHESVNGNR
ncbi:MAG: Fic family protein [Alphaproteobacteria bacterium]|nr:Fic family protein [Alphaproteobacteria bacterium]